MAGPDSKDSTCSQEKETFQVSDLWSAFDFKNLKVGVPIEFYSETTAIQPSVRRAMEQTLSWLKSKGATVLDVKLPYAKYSVAVYYVIAVSEASSNLSRFDGVHFGVRTKEATQAENADSFYEKARSLFGPEVKRRIILGTFALSSGYYDAYFTKACQVRRLIQDDFISAFKHCDVILGPVSTSGAFKRGELQNDPLAMYLNDLYTIPANLAGLPAMSFPVTKDEAGLPIGLQWMAPRFQDAKLLRLSAQFEKDHFGGGK
jgi:aspartyl-tRNA(Asn)/glutamyl-tRNA(Gln) amidotransferase subunit A